MRLSSFFFATAFFLQSVSAAQEHVDRYLEYLHSPYVGRLGDFTKGEMQIVDRYEDILAIQQQYFEEFRAKGCTPVEAEEYSRVGVVHEDRYWIWLRDPLILPNGKMTAYNRFFPKSSLDGAAGVSVMGVSPEGKILVNVIFRHATRAWELELPRGGRGKQEPSEQAALRELEEETGVKAKRAVKIASLASDSGILANVLDLFLVEDFLVSEETQREESEAIYQCLWLSKRTLKQALAVGAIEVDIQGIKTKVFCRDPFLASAILIAETKGML